MQSRFLTTTCLFLLAAQPLAGQVEAALTGGHLDLGVEQSIRLPSGFLPVYASGDPQGRIAVLGEGADEIWFVNNEMARSIPINGFGATAIAIVDGGKAIEVLRAHSRTIHRIRVSDGREVSLYHLPVSPSLTAVADRRRCRAARGRMAHSTSAIGH